MQDWDDIKYFLQVAKSGNVTSASAALGVNHSTVSRRIKAFEEKHAIRLFDRVPSGYQMTETGSAILEIAEEMERNSQRISRQLFALDSRLTGPISLTMPHDLLDYCLMPDIAQFKNKYPQVTLNLAVSKGIKNLAAREADVAVRFTPSPPEYLIGSQICKLQHGIYAHKDFNKSNKVKLILWPDEKEQPEWALNAFPKSEIALRVDDCYSMYSAVKMGIGIARLPCYLPDMIADPEVERLNIIQPPSDWGVWVLSHVDLRDTLRVKRCRDFLREALEAQRDWFLGEKSRFAEVARV